VRIGVITTSFPRWPGDYAGSFVEESVRRLLRDGHSVDIVAAGEAGNPPRTARSLTSLAPVELEDPMAAELGAAVRLARVPMPCSPSPALPNLFYERGAPEVLERGLPSAWLQAAAFCAGLCARVDAWAPAWDEIHAHWLLPCALLARAASLRRRAPGRDPLWASGRDRDPGHCPRALGATRSPPSVHGHAHSGDVALLERLAGGAALARWLGRELGDVTFASADLQRRFLGLVGGTTRARTHVAPAVVPRVLVSSPGPRGAARSDARAPSAAQPGDPQAVALGSAPRGFILAVGRLVPIKGFDVLLRAAALAEARSGAKAVVVILGDGPERARLTRSALRLGVELRLPGFVQRAEVDTWLRAASVYVQPSRTLWHGRTEGLPVSTLEALAHGVPVIASDSGGLAELAAPAPPDAAGSAIQIFRAGDHRALATMLEGVLAARWQEEHRREARNLAPGQVSAA
jgi:glycosyltransferase involved in cell wall biosynthesis